MTEIASHAGVLIVIAGRLDKTASDSRAAFADASRPNFDHYVIDAFMREARHLVSQASELDALLEQAVRLLQN